MIHKTDLKKMLVQVLGFGTALPEAVRIWKEIGNYKGEANSGKALRICKKQWQSDHHPQHGNWE